MLKDKIKSFTNDTITYGVFQYLGRLLTFLLTPLYSNYLSPAENGLLAYMFSLVIVIQMIYIFGMEVSFFRFFIPDNDAYNKKVYTASYISILILGAVCTILLIAFSAPLSNIFIENDFRNSVYIFQIVAMIPLIDSIAVIPLGKLRMQHKVKKFGVIRFLHVVLSVLLNAFFVMATDLGVLGIFLGQLIASVVSFIYFVPDVIKNLDFNIPKTLFKKMFWFGLPTLPSNLSGILLQVADRPIMKLFVDNANIGLYQINAKLAIPMLMFITIFDYAWKPFFLTHFKDDDAKPLFSRILTYYVFIGSILLLLISFFMDYVVRIPIWGGKTFIHSNYWAHLEIAVILSVGYLINGLTTNFAAVFHIEKKTKYLPIAVGISSIISIILNFTLIPIIGIIGASISLVIGYSTGAIIMKFLQSKVSYKIKYEWKRICIIVGSSSIIFTIGYILSIHFNLTVAFIIKIGLMLLYIILLKLFGFFTKGELAQINKMLKRK